MNRRANRLFRWVTFAFVSVAFSASCAKDGTTGKANGTQAINVAVAANFAAPMEEIARRFEAATRHRVMLSIASTGKHYAQIVNGAPFDVFIAADQDRPKRLEAEGRAISGTRFTYAQGKLVLLTNAQSDPPVQARIQTQTGSDELRDILAHNDFDHLAIANPQLAPYGRAAEEVLTSLGLWDMLQPRIVRGENISQAYQFVSSGAADLGFVAFAQVKRVGEDAIGLYWEVPQTLYTPIEQQAVLLTDNLAARELLAFLRGDVALDIIRDSGYDLP